MSVTYTVVVPVYNGQATLSELYRRVETVFAQLKETFELVFVEDCGQDDSWRVLCQLKNEHPETVTIVRLGKNFGQHNALLCGFQYARGQWVITLDDDLQTPPDEIPKLIEQQRRNAADLVYGIYKTKRHSLFRNLGSLLINKVTRYSFQMQNSGTSFRLLNANIARKLSAHNQRYVFIDGLIHWHTSFVDYTWVRHEARQQGKSGYNLFKLVSLASSMLFNFTTLPLQMVVWMGLLFSTVSFIIGVAYLLQKILYGAPMGYASIAVGVFFMGGVTLLVLGVIGQYLSRVLAIQNAKPPFSVKEALVAERPEATQTTPNLS